jgi:hypothetical protein
MTALPFFEWCEATLAGQTIRESLWLFPVIEAVHLVAFATLGGAVLFLDLRLLGWLFHSQPVARLAEAVGPWQRGSLALAVATGSLLFLSEPMKLYHSEPFWIKISCLALVVVFDFTVRSRATRGNASGLGARLVGLISLVLWSGVAWGGRWIGFSG